jgi:glutamate racemase
MPLASTSQTYNKPMTIGVFDSGIGGLSVANAIKQAMPEYEIIFKDDAQHLPYGSKTPDEILAFCLPVLESLVEDGCEIIVVACNTVSTNLIEPLRKLLPVPLVAVEPMVKPAAERTKSKKIIVCATPRTLQSERYALLKQTYAPGVEIIEPDCSNWTKLIEANEMNEAHITAAIEPGLQQGADVVVLGCTHYHWIEKQIKRVAGMRAEVLQPEPAVISQLQRLLT